MCHFCCHSTGLGIYCSVLIHCTKTADLVTFNEEIFNGKLHFLCSDYFGHIFDYSYFCLPRHLTFCPLSGLPYKALLLTLKRK